MSQRARPQLRAVALSLSTAFLAIGCNANQLPFDAMPNRKVTAAAQLTSLEANAAARTSNSNNIIAPAGTTSVTYPDFQGISAIAWSNAAGQTQVWISQRADLVAKFPNLYRETSYIVITLGDTHDGPHTLVEDSSWTPASASDPVAVPGTATVHLVQTSAACVSGAPAFLQDISAHGTLTISHASNGTLQGTLQAGTLSGTFGAARSSATAITSCIVDDSVAWTQAGSTALSTAVAATYMMPAADSGTGPRITLSPKPACDGGLTSSDTSLTLEVSKADAAHDNAGNTVYTLGKTSGAGQNSATLYAHGSALRATAGSISLNSRPDANGDPINGSFSVTLSDGTALTARFRALGCYRHNS